MKILVFGAGVDKNRQFAVFVLDDFKEILLFDNGVILCFHFAVLYGNIDFVLHSNTFAAKSQF